MRDRNTHDSNDDDNLTTVTVGTDAPSEALEGRVELAIHHQPKQGGKYFGYCCDYRRAVLILGAVHSSLALIDLSFYVGSTMRNTYEPPFDDDVLVDELIEMNADYRVRLIILESAAVAFGGVSMLGAWRFSRILTVLAILYAVSSTVILIFFDVYARLDANTILSNYGKATILTPIYYYVFLGILFLVWWYPSFFFLSELHRGIMTPETYVREDFSCFCQ